MKVKDMNLTYYDAELFSDIRKRIADGKPHNGTGEKSAIIGTLGEKTLHKILKYYYEPNEQYHEQKFCGYVCDIKKDSRITEIQTGSFFSIKTKLRDLLLTDIEDITVVYPIGAVRHLCWIDPLTGEVSRPSKSPKFMGHWGFFEHIYQIKDYIGNEKFRLKILLLEITEYKYLDGWGRHKKNNATKVDRIPVSVISEEEFYLKTDYLKFIPQEIIEKSGFISDDLKKSTGVSGRPLYSFIKIAEEIGIIKNKGKLSRHKYFEIVEK